MWSGRWVIPVEAGDRQSSSLPWVRILDKVGHLVLRRISMKISDDSESWIDSVGECPLSGSPLCYRLTVKLLG